METTTERNKQVKVILKKVFGKSVSVTGGRGTAYGWVGISIKAADPCPFKQKEAPCSSFLPCGIDRTCKGNNQPINGGWGGTVRQLEWSRIKEQVDKLLKDVDFDTYYGDEGFNNYKSQKMNIDIEFIEVSK